MRKPDLINLPNQEGVNEFIIDLDNYVSELCVWGEELNVLTNAQRTFFLNQNFEREINNGGFSLFFSNSSGDFAHETLLSLKEIGANKTVQLLQLAIIEFPNAIVPKDKAEREILLEQIHDNSSETWENLEEQFYMYEDDLNTLNLEYIKNNLSKF